MESKRSIISDTKSRFQNSLKLTPGGKYDADVNVNWDVKKGNVNTKIESELNLDGKKLKLDTGLESSPDKINNFAQFHANDIKYLDYNLKVTRGAAPKGNLGLTFKDYLVANGQFSYQNGKGNGNLNLEIPKINRKIKGSGDVAVTGNKHAANFELLYDAEKDPNKKIKISTDSDITKNSIDSKNIIELLAYKTAVDVKGKLDGEFNNGNLEGEVDLTLPNERFLTARVKRSISKKDDKIDGQAHWEFADHVKKGGPSRKVTFDAEGKVHSLKDKNFQTNYNIKYVNFDGQDLTGKLGLKNLAATGDKKTAEAEISGGGSILAVPISLHGAADYDPNSVNFKGSLSRGNDFYIKVKIVYVF